MYDHQLSTRHRKQHQPGFVAVLALLIVVVIGMGIYFMYAKTIFRPTGNINILADPKAQKPWLEEERIVTDNQIISMPEPPKPLLNESKSFSLAVTRNDKPRGQIEITFADNGKVRARWQAQFEQAQQSRTYQATFDGNIDTEKTCRHDGKSYDSYLYFIAKGPYTNTLKNENGITISQEEGTAYITGYLTPQYTFRKGTITLTTDKTWSAHYQF